MRYAAYYLYHLLRKKLRKKAGGNSGNRKTLIHIGIYVYSMKERINISIDTEVAKAMRIDAIERYGSLRAFSQLIEDAYTHKNPDVTTQSVKTIKAVRGAIREKHEAMMVKYREKAPEAAGYYAGSWQKNFMCNTCEAEFRITHDEGKYCPVCGSINIIKQR